MSNKIRNKPQDFLQGLLISDQKLTEEEFLQEYKLPELQFCHNDFRKLKHYTNELKNGSFAVEIYTDSLDHISGEPDGTGWLCLTKTLYVHNGYVYQDGKKLERLEYSCYTGFHTKAIFTIRKTANNEPNSIPALEMPSIVFSQ